MEEKLTLTGYRRNDDGTFQIHVESIIIADLKKGGFKFDKNESIMGDHFLLTLHTKIISGDIRDIRIYITESNYEKFRSFIYKQLIPCI